MNRLHRKGPIVAKVSLLLLGGVGAGVFASSLTTSSIAWRPTSRVPMVEQAVADPVDQGSAGRNWARTAFDGGLRRCPEMNAEFLAACQAEMKLLLEKPKLAYGSYGGPLLITKYEGPPIDTYRPAEENFDLPPSEEAVEPEVAQSVLEPTPVNYPALEPTVPAAVSPSGTAPSNLQ